MLVYVLAGNKVETRVSSDHQGVSQDQVCTLTLEHFSGVITRIAQ